MYYIKLTFGSDALTLSHGNGYDISTITGLNGLTGKINTVQSNLGMGEIYTDGSVSGIRITVQGYILDANNTAKQNLINKLTPLREGKLTLYNIKRDSREEPYLETDIVVYQTPTITQTKHSKFAFVLYAPCPFWRETEYVSIGNGTTMPATIKGTVDCDYTMRVIVPTSSVHLATMVMYLDRYTDHQKYLNLDFRRLSAGYVAGFDTVVLRREKGKLIIELNDGQGNIRNIMEVLNANSNLYKIPAGSHSFEVYCTDENGTIIASPSSLITDQVAWGFYYYPQYSGVALSGI